MGKTNAFIKTFHKELQSNAANEFSQHQQLYCKLLYIQCVSVKSNANITIDTTIYISHLKAQTLQVYSFSDHHLVLEQNTSPQIAPGGCFCNLKWQCYGSKSHQITNKEYQGYIHRVICILQDKHLTYKRTAGQGQKYSFQSRTECTLFESLSLRFKVAQYIPLFKQY